MHQCYTYICYGENPSSRPTLKDIMLTEEHTDGRTHEQARKLHNASATIRGAEA